MARAYIVLARNDLDASLLQVLDLGPNSSQFSPAYEGQDSGQTGYQTWYAGDSTVNSTAATSAPGAGGGASVDSDGDLYGLAAYLVATVEDQGSNAAITAAVANATRDAIFDLVEAGSALTAAAIANALTANGVANAGGGTSLTAGDSIGSVEEVLRILAGEVYKLDDATQLTTAAGAFDATTSGYFVQRPEVEVQDSKRNASAIGVRGRKSTAPLTHLRPGEVRAGQAPTLGAQEDTLFRDVRTVIDTGHLHLSLQSGVLAELAASTYAFVNPSFSYNGDALAIGGTSLGSTGVGRAVVVYDASGNVL